MQTEIAWGSNTLGARISISWLALAPETMYIVLRMSVFAHSLHHVLVSLAYETSTLYMYLPVTVALSRVWN